MRKVCVVIGSVALAAMATAVASAASGMQPTPRAVQPSARAAHAEPGPLERIAVRPSLDLPAPRRRAHVAPEWPAGTGGRVRYRVHLVIEAGGSVAEARIVSFSGPADRQADEAAEVAAVLAAVRQWTFDEPAQAPMLLDTYVGTGESEGVVVPSPAERRPIRIGGEMRPPTKVHHVSPEYPTDALSAGISGVVIVEATIDPAGAVTDVRLVRSLPGLDDAAIAAVRQWRYTPTWLNGEPVPVIMTVTVNFQPQ